MGRLSQFLSEQKNTFLKDVEAGNVEKWTVVMGNEAGDLDSAASSIAYAVLSTAIHSRPSIALLLTARGDLHLRSENLYAFERAQLASDHQDLLCIDDLSSPLPSLSKLALVDHNRLTAAFQNGRGTVVGVIDHHDDEGLYPNADPREIIVPTGSCASLVTRYFRQEWEHNEEKVPREIASLLLSAILIDTGGLKPKGKTQNVDRESASFLVPLAGILPASASLDEPDSAPVPQEAQELFTTLVTQKQDVSRLSTRDLLRRDYKQYFIASSIHVGLSTVPLGLKPWTEKDTQLWYGVEEWMAERGLDAAGILTSYRSKHKGRHRRQVAVVVRDSVAAGLREALWTGMEGSEELQLNRKAKIEGNSALGERVRVWQQDNVDATRKQVAPLMTRIIEGYVGQHKGSV